MQARASQLNEEYLFQVTLPELFILTFEKLELCNLLVRI